MSWKPSRRIFFGVTLMMNAIDDVANFVFGIRGEAIDSLRQAIPDANKQCQPPGLNQYADIELALAATVR